MTRKRYEPPQVLEIEPGALTDELLAELEKSGMRRVKCEGCGCDLLTRGESNKCPPCAGQGGGDALDLLTSPAMMNAVARYCFGKAREFTGEPVAPTVTECLCLDCLDLWPLDEIGQKAVRELSLAFSPREVAEVLVMICPCGGEGCICPECIEVGHGRPLNATTQPCPKLAAKGLPRVRGPEA